ncbi:MAG TPA: rRNA maturation RNase YbeY [Nitrospiraceae bacterium]|nr:rRNA maturation RNase YbeY [Nitrospiraceae bacterium]
MPVIVTFRLGLAPIKRAVWERLGQDILRLIRKPHAEVSVLLVGDRRMRRLNKQYRKRDKSTDVLAFPLQEGPGPRTVLLGDVVICVPMARRQARESNHSLERELTVLLVHGILHLCGYDHERGVEEARRMQRRERAILRQVSIGTLVPTGTR